MAKRWYSVSVLSNFEKKVAEQIKTAVAEAGLQEEIDEVLVRHPGLIVERPDLARIDLPGIDPDQIVRRGIFQVMEGRRIIGDMTCQENLRLGAFTRRDGQVELVLDGLTAFDEDHIDELTVDAEGGPVRLKLIKPCSRCQIPNVDPASAEHLARFVGTGGNQRQPFGNPGMAAGRRRDMAQQLTRFA